MCSPRCQIPGKWVCPMTINFEGRALSLASWTALSGASRHALITLKGLVGGHAWWANTRNFPQTVGSCFRVSLWASMVTRLVRSSRSERLWCDPGVPSLSRALLIDFRIPHHGVMFSNIASPWVTNTSLLLRKQWWELLTCGSWFPVM